MSSSGFGHERFPVHEGDGLGEDHRDLAGSQDTLGCRLPPAQEAIGNHRMSRPKAAIHGGAHHGDHRRHQVLRSRGGAEGRQPQYQARPGPRRRRRERRREIDAHRHCGGRDPGRLRGHSRHRQGNKAAQSQEAAPCRRGGHVPTTGRGERDDGAGKPSARGTRSDGARRAGRRPSGSSRLWPPVSTPCRSTCGCAT